MPLYEYVSKEDGTVIELLRPMGEADSPVVDPEGKGRTFIRRHSTFATAGGPAGSSGSGGGHVHSGMCGCGKAPGSCGGRN